MQKTEQTTGCGPMIVWYLRICCYIGLAAAFCAFLVPNNTQFAWTLIIVCGLFLLLTRKKKNT